MVSGRPVMLKAVYDGCLFVSRIKNLHDEVGRFECVGGVYAALEAGVWVCITTVGGILILTMLRG